MLDNQSCTRNESHLIERTTYMRTNARNLPAIMSDDCFLFPDLAPAMVIFTHAASKLGSRLGPTTAIEAFQLATMAALGV
jgi:hypothetical protein